MTFKHEVFISYRHIPPDYAAWVKKAFYKTIKDIIENETGNENAVYIDLQNLEGEDWKNQVFPALIQSKVVVSFWTPFYFKADCIAIQEYIIANNRRINSNVESIFPISLTEKKAFLNNPHNMNPYDCKAIFNRPSLCLNSSKFNSEIKTITNKILEKISSIPSDKLDLDYFDFEKWKNVSDDDLKTVSSQYVNLEHFNKNVTKALI